VSDVGKVGERPLQELAQAASEQTLLLAREQVDAALRELTARARQAGPPAAMVGGGAVLAALASGTGTAALILLLARRPGASAAALGVTGAYAGAGAFLTRAGLVRLREAGPDVTDRDEPAQKAAPVPDKPVQNAKRDLGSAKRRADSVAKSTRRRKSPATARPQPTGRPKQRAKSPSSRPRAARPQTDRGRSPEA
jgi:hypothetical protein